MTNEFEYCGEKFADLQILRYCVQGFEQLSLKQKLYIYYLAKATLCGRDITTDQFGKYNLRIRKVLEAIYCNYSGNREDRNFEALVVYLKRVWFSNGIYHHYGCDKFQPGFSKESFIGMVDSISEKLLPLRDGETVEDLCKELVPVIFDADVLPMRVNKKEGEDLVQTSACNYYDSLTQNEVEAYYDSMRNPDNPTPVSYGLNTTLIKDKAGIHEEAWTSESKYGDAIKKIIFWLEKACEVTENEQQQKVIELLIEYYRKGDLKVFDEYSVEWLKEQSGQVDFINGFIEVYGDPLGIKGSWEGIVTYKDLEATKRTRTISRNAQWFEDNSPVDSRFKKDKVVGVTANVVCTAMLGGDEYPSTAIGINLPNADWIRAAHGSKSITIANLTHAYNMASKGNGFLQEFVVDAATMSLIDKYGDICDDLHTDLHECLGHGSGRLLPTTSPDALKSYSDTIEEARADLFGLYYIADPKLQELGLVPDEDAYKSQYYTYMMNGLMTQLTRIKPGNQIQEAHMRNRSLIVHWVLEHYPEAVSLEMVEGKTYTVIHDYQLLRKAFARLLAEIQRIKSEGDLDAAKSIVERYGIKVDSVLHEEVLERYARLDIAPYKGFLNPKMELETDETGNVVDVKLDYSETYEQQMLRYSEEYSFL